MLHFESCNTLYAGLLQFIADSFYVRGLASKFVHLFISTLHFPNEVSPPGFVGKMMFSSSYLGKFSRLQRPATLLDHRQWFCMSTQYFHIRRGEMILATIQQMRSISGWQDAFWGAGCSETFPWSLWSNWWCGLQVVLNSGRKMLELWSCTERTSSSSWATLVAKK